MNQQLIKRTVEIAYAMTPTIRELRTTHVSFLIKSGKIVHIGWNKKRTHPFNLQHPYHEGFVGLHSELDVCLKSGKDDLSGYEIVVIRVNRNDKLTMSKPCNGCASVLKQFGIKDIWYSNNDGKVVKV